MTRSAITRLALCAALAAPLWACKEEGPAERAGKKFDEAIEKLREGDEGSLEKAGREFDEAVEELEEDVEDVRKDVADAIEGDD